MRRRWVLAGGAALAGCSLLPQTPYVWRRDWPLDVQLPSTAPSKRRGRVLLVRSVQAGPGLDVRGMQWLQRDGSVHVDFYEQWAVPPAEAVGDNLQRWLANSGLFSAVVTTGSRLNADFVLEGSLNVFIADLNAGVARVALALVLIDQRQGMAKVLLQRTETAEVKLPSDEPPAIAETMRSAIVEVMRQVQAVVARATR
jgi:cholesterol transport system auxiliary component